MGASSDVTAAEPPWFSAVERRYGGPVSVVGSRLLSGGYVSDDVRRYELLCAGRPVSVVWKRTTAREVAALRAVDEVPGIGGPRLLAHGGSPGPADRSWVLMPHHAGSPLVDGQPVPDSAYEILARVHAHHRGRPVPGLPVVDAEFWRGLCLDVALPAIRGAAARVAADAVRSGEAAGASSGADGSLDVVGAPAVETAGAAQAVYRDAETRLLAWSSDRRMLTALSMLPATLAHGDLHRGNILQAADDAVIIDWGGARIAPGGLDLAVLAEQGGVDHDRYHRRIVELTGTPVVPALVEVEQQWALAMGYVQYLGFAADYLGADRVGVMIDQAAKALDRLGPALDRL